ncbi:MAG: hypothetical protein AAGD32_14880, partial [Planctomycetota bacterium]
MHNVQTDRGVEQPELPLRIFALLGDAQEANTGTFKVLRAKFATMLERYRARDWDGALTALL